MTTHEFTLPLFPLHAVLFPGGILPLQIFEPRYLDMVSDCLRTDTSFGVCLIREGQAATVGTTTKIIDWYLNPEGLLNLVVVGQSRFQVISKKILSNQLIEAEVSLFPPEPVQAIPFYYIPLSKALEKFVNRLGETYQQISPPEYHNATWLTHRLAELLPISFSQRQHLLELNDSLQRLEVLTQIISSLY